jgi:hypothetical protein
MDFFLGPLELPSQIIILFGHFELFLLGMDFVVVEGLASFFEKSFLQGYFFVVGLNDSGEGSFEVLLEFRQE